MLLTGKRIFYIEDDVKNRSIVQVILEHEGAILGFERWGREEVVTRLQSFMPVDLILLDLMFPQGVTGYDVFDVIRSQPEFAHVPIVAVSASDAAVEVPRTQAKGFAGFIGKPVNMFTFPQYLVSAMNGEPVWP